MLYGHVTIDYMKVKWLPFGELTSKIFHLTTNIIADMRACDVCYIRVLL